MQLESGYQETVAAQMALLSAITYVQFGEKQPEIDKLTFEGIEPAELVAAEKAAIKGYRQVASFTARDTNWLWIAERGDRPAKTMLQHLFWLSMKFWVYLLYCIPIFNKKELFGFAIEPANDDVLLKANIIALRGTGDTNEWFVDASLLQMSYRMYKHYDGKVHGGFGSLYAEMASQIKDAVSKFKDQSLPLIITGHSLGAALATLAAFNIAHEYPAIRPKLMMYNFASPKVGDAEFVKKYNQMIPNSFRVVNLADLVPMMPPRDLEEGLLYGVVGQAYAYLNQTDDLADNHSITKNYWDAVIKGQPTKAERLYPIKAIQLVE